MKPREERLQILNMLSNGKVTVDEAEELLAALGESRTDSGREEASADYGADSPLTPPPANSGPSSDRRRKNVNIVVRDGEKQRVNITVPLPMIRSISRFIPGGMGAAAAGGGDGDIDVDTIIQAVESGAEGKLVDIRKGDSRVEVWVEE